jgi:hypothetical protein
VSDPDESAPFRGERSTLASMGSRRVWFFRPSEEKVGESLSSTNGDSPQIFHSMLGDLASRAGHAADAEAAERTDERPASTNEISPQIFHSMLGDLASRAGAASEAEAARAAVATGEEAAPPRSLLSLDGAAEQAAAIARAAAARAAAARPLPPQPAARARLAVAPQPAAVRSGAATPSEAIARALATVRVAGVARSAGPRSEDSDDAPAPLTQHSTIAELAGLEEHVSRAFPIERAILISLAAHVLFVILMLVAPGRSAAPQGNLIDLMAAAMQTPKDDTPIPAYFTEAPGAPRENPKRSPLSDADRRAGGGDPAKPKADLPYVPRSRGIEGLAPGPRAPRVAGGPAAAAPKSAQKSAEAAAAENRAALQKPDPSAEQKASEFPADMRPQLGGEPKEIVRLTRNQLDEAIRDAARGTVRGQAGGGENGAPISNEDGGFVDVGGVSFETSWYDWGPYAAEMLRRIKLHWKISRDLIILQQRGSVAFSIMADGSVADVKVLRPSTIPPYTHAAAKAIFESDPFRPLPKDLLQLVPGKDRERIVIHFIYFPTPEELDGRSDGSEPGR